LELSSYLEVVATHLAADRSHPAFSKLFIESDYDAEHGIFFSKRRGAPSQSHPYLFHFSLSKQKAMGDQEFENDRLRFIGRNRGLEAPQAMIDNRPLTCSTAFSNDPIMSLRNRYFIEAESSLTITYFTGVAKSKEEAIAIYQEFSLPYCLQDVMEKYRQQSLMEMKYLSITGSQLDAFQNLISPLYYPSYYFRADGKHVAANQKNQSGLWRFGISGDDPIMVVKVSSAEETSLIKEVVKAYQYLRLNLIKVDLVILSEAPYGYLRELDDLFNNLTRSMKIYESWQRPSFFIVHTYQMNAEEMDLLLSVARIVFTKETGIYFRQAVQKMKEAVQASRQGGESS
jgi:cellobiose phosphorylase